MENLIIPEKEKLNAFLEKNFEKNNFNIGIIGSIGTGKSIICNHIIETFIKKQPAKYQQNPKNIIYRWNCFEDVNLLDENNNLDIFCKNNTGCSKLVFIEIFEDLSDTHQQNLKIYIDKYNIFKDKNKIYFLIKTSDKMSIKDILRARIQLYEQNPTTHKEHLVMITKFIDNYNISVDETVIQRLLNIPNINFHNIKHTFDKASIMNINKIDITNILSLTTIIDYSVFEKFIEFVKEFKFTNAVKCLDNLFVDGYDIGDIYFFFYEYIKTCVSVENISDKFNYKIIEILCKYINEMYNGFYDRFVLVLFTFDVYDVYCKLNETIPQDNEMFLD